MVAPTISELCAEDFEILLLKPDVKRALFHYVRPCFYKLFR